MRRLIEDESTAKNNGRVASFSAHDILPTPIEWQVQQEHCQIKHPTGCESFRDEPQRSSPIHSVVLIFASLRGPRKLLKSDYFTRAILHFTRKHLADKIIYALAVKACEITHVVARP